MSVSFEFYGDSSILGLSFLSGHEVFLDLDEIRRVALLTPAEQAESDGERVVVYWDSADVRELFGAHGCLETCLLGGVPVE